MRFEEKLLLNSVEITIEDAVQWISSHGGVAIPSHIDSKSFSVISQLGYVPDDISFDALEVRDLKKYGRILPPLSGGVIYPLSAFQMHII